MSTEKRDPGFRTVNPLLGVRPSFGPIPADLLVPWGVISVALFMLSHSILGLEWHWTIALIVWGDLTYWMLAGSKPYRFLSRFMPPPKTWTKGYVRYAPCKPQKRVRH